MKRVMWILLIGLALSGCARSSTDSVFWLYDDTHPMWDGKSDERDLMVGRALLGASLEMQRQQDELATAQYEAHSRAHEAFLLSQQGR